MKNFTLLIVSLFLSVPLIGQIPDPSKEEMEKYGKVLNEIPRAGYPIPTSSVIRKVDSLYQLDSNSIILKMILIEMNMILIYDSVKTERIPQTISILNLLEKSSNSSEEKITFKKGLAGLYFQLGKFKIAKSYYKKILEAATDSNDKIFALNNLANISLKMGNTKKALHILRQIKSSKNLKTNTTLLSEIYYKNNFIDSATSFVDKALLEDTVSYMPQLIKAKVLIEKDKTQEACLYISNALNVFNKNDFEQKIITKSKDNPYFKSVISDLKEIKHLKEKYCN